MLASDEETIGENQDPFGKYYYPQSATLSSPTRQQGSFMRWLFLPSDRQIKRLRYSQSVWQKIFRWRIGMVNIVPATLFFSGLLIACASAVVVFPTWKPLIIGYVTLLGVLQPILFMGLACTQYLKQIPYSLMLPVRRCDYFREWMLAFSISHFMIWCIFSLTMALSFCMILDRESWHLLPKALLLSLGINIFYQGLILWISRINSVLASLLTFSPTMLFPGIFITISRNNGYISWTLAVCMFAGMAFIGIFAGFSAYCRWSDTEVGLIGNAISVKKHGSSDICVAIASRS